MNLQTLTPSDAGTRLGAVDLELYLEQLAQHEQGLVVDIAKPAGGAPHEPLDWRGSSARSSAMPKIRLNKRKSERLRNGGPTLG